MEKIYHKQHANRFEMMKDGYLAYVEYETDGCSLDVLHTVVPKAIGGRGVAAALVEAAYNYGASMNLNPKASCSYAAAWLKRKGN